MWVWYADRNKDQVLREICWDRRGAGLVIGGKGGGMAGFGGYHGRSVGQAPADCLRGRAEVPPSGVVFCVACHLRHRDGVPVRGGQAV